MQKREREWKRENGRERASESEREWKSKRERKRENGRERESESEREIEWKRESVEESERTCVCFSDLSHDLKHQIIIIKNIDVKQIVFS